MGAKKLYLHVAGEEFCCMAGYLNLCRARGETRKQMAQNANVTFWTIKHHYKQLAKGVHSCQRVSFCMKAQIEEVRELFSQERASRVEE